MISELGPLLIPLVAIPVTFSVPIIWIVLNYRKRLRLMELYHAERMAAIERGMELPPLPVELIDGRTRRRRSSLLPGLVWFFIGFAAVLGSVIDGDFDDDFPLFGGFIPLGIGLAYLIYYGVEGRDTEKRQLEQELRERENGRYSQGPSPL